MTYGRGDGALTWIRDFQFGDFYLNGMPKCREGVEGFNGFILRYKARGCRITDEELVDYICGVVRPWEEAYYNNNNGQPAAWPKHLKNRAKEIIAARRKAK